MRVIGVGVGVIVVVERPGKGKRLIDPSPDVSVAREDSRDCLGTGSSGRCPELESQIDE
jgi:hypothetical protein